MRSPVDSAGEPRLVTEPRLEAILEELKLREPIFHRLGPHAKRSDFEDMMAPSFWEIGASGRRYSRAFVLDILDTRRGESQEETWQADGFHCLEIAPGNFLLTYTLTLGGRMTRRSTVWRRTSEGWRIVFHQGTTVEQSPQE